MPSSTPPPAMPPLLQPPLSDAVPSFFFQTTHLLDAVSASVTVPTESTQTTDDPSGSLSVLQIPRAGFKTAMDFLSAILQRCTLPVLSINEVARVRRELRGARICCRNPEENREGFLAEDGNPGRAPGEYVCAVRAETQSFRYQRQRWRDILQRFGQCLSPTEKRYCRYPPKSKLPPISCETECSSHVDTAERRVPVDNQVAALRCSANTAPQIAMYVHDLVPPFDPAVLTPKQPIPVTHCPLLYW